jgi:hypothetical protein
MYNAALHHVRLVFVPPQLFEQPDTISLQESAFMEI